MSSTTKHPRRRLIASVLAAAAVPGLIAVAPAGTASADVCVGAGRRITVSGCTNFADAVAPYAPPPAYYAPLPEDMPPPPPPPVSGCVGWHGRWVSANTCN